MQITGRGASRRTVLATAAGALVAAGLARAGTAAAASDPVWSAEYWARKGPVNLYLYRKRAGAPPANGKGASLPVLFLVHGSSFCGRSTYDLTVPGASGYSMMDVFAGLGYDVWTMDHEGYGRSSHTPGNSDIASGVADLAAAMEVVQRE